jgi:5-methylcytosine-specific restriction enzyme subunit McrC
VANTIPIHNVYYLLCYAWNRLEQAAIADTSNLPTTKLADLFATVLCSGIDHLARRGLEKCFDAQHETLSGIRGRIDFAGSLRKNSFIQGQAVCVFDEVSLNTIANGIIKTTVEQLLKYGELNRELRARLRTVARSLRNIREIKLTGALFSKVQVSSNRAFYGFLLDVCEFVYNSWLVDESNGDRKFRDFTRDDAAMARLFESFLFNFIARECLQWSVAREDIKWSALSETDPELRYLPRMRTDISAWRTGEYKIIDAKFYTNTLSSHYDVEKLHNANLYQILSYLMNAKTIDGVQPKGMLIYPRVDRDLREEYRILGKTISVRTVNLNAPWKLIDQELRQLMQ